MTRWTTKTANAYLNQYGFRVEKNVSVTATRTNRQRIGNWNLYFDNQRLGFATLNEAVEGARYILLEERPTLASAIGENYSLLPDGSSTELACPVDYEQPVVVAEFQPEVLSQPVEAINELVDEYPCHVTKLGWFNEATVTRSCSLPETRSHCYHVDLEGFDTVADMWGTFETHLRYHPVTNVASGALSSIETQGYWRDSFGRVFAPCCSVTYHFSPIDEFGNQEVICCQDTAETSKEATTENFVERWDRLYQEARAQYGLAETARGSEDMAEVRDTSFKEQLINTWSGRLTETDDNIPATRSYLTEEEYQRDQHLMEF